MKVLVTGGAGFVGRHLVAGLLARGDRVDTIDLRPMLIDSGTAHEHLIGDARNFFRLADDRYDLVLHCAAVVGGRAKIDNEPLDLAVDLAVDADLFAWALRTRPGKLVYFSSSAAYPTLLQARGSGMRLREDHIDLDLVQTPDAIYGWVKLTGEMLARHARREGLDVLVVRPFSGYGPDQDLTYPFPSFIDRAARRADPFEIWGDGEQIRDFIHIDDVVGAVLAAVEQDVTGPVNLGTGRPTSFNQLARIVCEQAGYAPQLQHVRSAPVGVHYRVANAARMREFYTPQITLEDGVAQALAAAKVAA